jgi:hypothetical protein
MKAMISQGSDGSIRRSSEIRVKTEMEINCFLAHIIGAEDSLLVQINQELGLRIPIEDVKLETVDIELKTINKGYLLEHLNGLIFKKTSWLWLLNEIRNHSLKRERIPRHARVNIIENVNNNISHSDQTIHFVESARNKDNPFLQEDIIFSRTKKQRFQSISKSDRFLAKVFDKLDSSEQRIL